MRNRVRVISIAVVAGALLAGCGGGGSGGSTAPNHTPYASVTFDTTGGFPGCSSTTAGFTISKQKAEVQAINQSNESFSVTWTNGSVVAGTQTIGPKATATTTLDFTTSGTYNPVCKAGGQTVQNLGEGLQVK